MDDNLTEKNLDDAIDELRKQAEALGARGTWIGAASLAGAVVTSFIPVIGTAAATVIVAAGASATATVVNSKMDKTQQIITLLASKGSSDSNASTHLNAGDIED